MKTILAAVLLSLTSGAAFAQKEPLRPAPVPNIDSGTVTPADRAGNATTSDNAAPFSGVPSSGIAGGGQPTPSDTAGSAKEAPPTPSLSR